LISQTNK